MSDTQESQPPKKDKGPYVPGQPLPRLWKTEPEPEEDPDELIDPLTGKKGAKAKDKGASAPASRPSSPSRPAAKKPAKSKSSRSAKAAPGDGENGEKRVLLEETPRFDTIETRQRVRLIVGGLIAFCMLLMAWIAYRMLFYDPSEITLDAVPPDMAAIPAEPRPSHDHEADYMLDRAREFAKRGDTKQAVGMLKRVVQVFKGSRAAGEARAALDRPKQNLPLFPDGPYVLAEQKPVAATTPETRPLPPGQRPDPVTGPTAPPPVVVVDRGAGPGGSPVAQPSPQPPPVAAGSGSNPGSIGSYPASPGVGPGMTPARPNDVAVASPPPPGPGQAAILIPSNGGNAAAPPPGGGNPDAAGAAVPRTPAERTLPPGFKAKLEAGRHAESGWPLVIIGERDGGNMILVPGGTFTMGNEGGESDEGPVHTVRLSTYYIDQTEVTNRQFRTFLEATHYTGRPPGKWLTDAKLRSQPDGAPVVFVGYNDAEAYAMWALKRLPTEAQWEMAARSGDGRLYPWGHQPARWSRARQFRQVDPVMSFPEDVSPYGAFDMAGNVMEWVRDWYEPRYFDKLRDKITDDPTGPPTKRHGIDRVVKGGSKDWTASWRQGVDLDRRLDYLGFRCSLAVEGGEASAIIAPHPPRPATPQPGPNIPDGQVGGEVPF